MPSYMYILECYDGSYYTGSTKDLERRLWQHQNGEGANFTKKRLPVKLIYAEPFDRVEDAFRREKQVQGWSRRKKKALIEGNYDKLIEFSRNYAQYGESASTSSASGDSKPFLEPVEGNTALAETASTSPASGGNEPFSEPVEGNTALVETASTSSASGGSEPFPEPAEGNATLAETASTSSASGITNGPLPELAEGSGDLAEQLAEESRPNALIQENLAKVVVDDA